MWSYFFKGWEEIRCLSYKIDVLVLRLARAVLGERKMSSVVRLVILGVTLATVLWGKGVLLKRCPHFHLFSVFYLCSQWSRDPHSEDEADNTSSTAADSQPRKPHHCQ